MNVCKNPMTEVYYCSNQMTEKPRNVISIRGRELAYRGGTTVQNYTPDSSLFQLQKNTSNLGGEA